MVIKIRPSTDSDVAEVARQRIGKLVSAGAKPLPDFVNEILDGLDETDSVTITSNADRPISELTRTSVEVRGYMTNPNFRHKGITLTLLDEQTPKLVIQRGSKEY